LNKYLKEIRPNGRVSFNFYIEFGITF